MQQPSFGSQGQTSGYAPVPPARKGPSFLACCLGCLGLAAVLAVALGIFGYVRVNRAAGPAITEANYRSMLPPDVPLYPGMTLDATMTRAMRAASGAIALIPGTKGASLKMMAFRCDKDLNVVGPWYQEKLTKAGYTFSGTTINARTGSVRMQASKAYMFRKGEVDILLSEGNSSRQGQFIMLGVGRNLPRSGNRNPFESTR